MNSSVPQSKEKIQIKWISFWNNKQNILFSAAILIITFMLYLPCLQNGFVNWDDQIYIYENPFIINISNWHTLFEYTKGIFTTNVTGSYNPLPILSFAFEKMILGVESPQWWHLNNIILHLIGVLLVFRITLALGLKLIPAAFCAILFGIHPMRVESVAWITERKDVLYGSFYLVALYYYIKSVKLSFQKRYLLIIHLSFILSSLSKIQAVSLPLSMLVIDYYFDRKLSMKLIFEKWSYFLISLLTGLVGINFINSTTAFEINKFIPLFKRILFGSYSYLIYLIKSVVPYKMAPFYPFPDTLDWTIFASMGLVPVILGATYYLFLKKKKVVVFGMLFFTFNIMFILQIFGAGKAFLADRFTYIAYWGLFLIYAFCFQWLVEQYKKFDKLIYLTVFAILSIYGYLNFEQNKIWKNGETLWSHELIYYPGHFLPWLNRANYYYGEGRLSETLHDLNKAIAANPFEAEAYDGRGVIYFNSGLLRLALEDFNKAIHINPNDPDYYNKRLITYYEIGDIELARKDLNFLKSKWPKDINKDFESLMIKIR